MADQQRSSKILSELRDMGSLIALDDFGTRILLSRIPQGLPVDTLKIDRTFIRDIGADEKTGPFVPPSYPWDRRSSSTSWRRSRDRRADGNPPRTRLSSSRDFSLPGPCPRRSRTGLPRSLRFALELVRK
jgi:hypothetical protein